MSEAWPNRTPEYAAWVNMKERCGNPKLRDYHRYGGRGIRVCDRWNDSYEAFLSDMGRRPSPSHSLDRYPNSDGNYEPGNCRWATRIEQARNKSDNRRVIVNGAAVCITEAAEMTGVSRKTIARRLDTGKTGAEVFAPVVKPQRFSFRGRELTAEQICEESGIGLSAFWRRIHRHGDADIAIAEWQKNGRGKRPSAKRERAA